MSGGDLLRRAAAVSLVALFPLAAGGELLPGHLCPHHDAAFVGGGHATGEAAHGPGSGTPMPVHARPGDAAGPTGGPDPGSPDEPTHPCTCIGSCHAGGAVALLAEGPVLHATSSTRPVVAPRTSADPVLAPVPYLLPYANAPPIA